MDAEKYADAIDLILDKFGLPDFAYQAKIVSDVDKEKVREIIKQIKEKMYEVCQSVEPGKNNVVVPFNEILKKSFPKERAFDMTTATRFGGFLSLLSIINIDKRPRLVILKGTENEEQEKEYSLSKQTTTIIPFALFEDLQETIFLMEHANGVRPYVLEWYYNVFLAAYKKKTQQDSKVNSKGELITEKRIAITTEQLAETTKEVYKRTLTTKKILEVYVNPLINEGYIDKTASDLDHRSNIYYPVILTTTTNEEREEKNRKLFENEQSNNFSQKTKLIVTDPTLYPDRQYIISKIHEIVGYSSGKGLSQIKIESHEGKEITVEDLVERYYDNPENFFETHIDNSNIKNGGGDGSSLQQQAAALPLSLDSIVDYSDEYFQKDKIASESQENSSESVESLKSRPESDKKLFDGSKSNNFLSSCYHCSDFHANDLTEYLHQSTRGRLT